MLSCRREEKIIQKVIDQIKFIFLLNQQLKSHQNRMKLKKLLKEGKKQAKKEQVKQEVEQKTKVDDDEQQRDDALIDIKQDIKKKQQNKPKVSKRVETNKLEETQNDTSKILLKKNQETKKPHTTWVVEQSDVKNLLEKDFKLHEVQHEFESLTDTKLNQELRQKKQKLVEEQVVETLGQMKFAPLQSEPLESRTTEKLVMGKPKTETQSIGFSITPPALNFTNTKLGATVNVAPLEKPQQLYDDEYDRKAKQRLEQSRKEQQEVAKTTGKGGWFKNKTTEAPKEAPKIEFKSSPMTFSNTAMTFTNSALTGKNQEQTVDFRPIEKSKQQQIYERKQQEFVFVNKKQQQERRKKREEEQLQKQPPTVETQPKA